MTKISVHIDRLVLPREIDGQEVASALREAIRTEAGLSGSALTGLRSEGSAAKLDAGRVSASTGPAGLAQAVSRAMLGQSANKGRRGS